MDNKKYETVKLSYAIHSYSSFSAKYVPENIMVNNPSDQLSRWFTDTSTPSQFIMLKLDTPCIVETIKFGKYLKAHVSDLKKFKILGGTDDKNLSELLTAGLKKDSHPETFGLRHRTQEGLYMPIKYLKIVPLQSWGPAHNYTVWYIELHGKDQQEIINEAMKTINLRKEEEAVRLLLKHLRRRRYKDAFEALSRESGVQLEGETQAKLWTALVENGDYKLAEQIFDEAVNDGELEWYQSYQPYKPEWQQVSPCSADVEARLCCADAAPPVPPRHHLLDLAPDAESNTPVPAGSPSESQDGSLVEETEPRLAPGPRGGHQLVVDPTTGTLYLFGGWSGTTDLDDLWSFDPHGSRWTLLCSHSGQEGGPSPRSCHKMVFDPRRRRLYTLGRYLDNKHRHPDNMKSDLCVFDVERARWAVVSADTAAAGGPQLVFDHQMCIDADTQTVYVFGGRVLPPNTEETASPLYSGLYAYSIPSNTWRVLLADSHELPAPQPRVSHSMLFHPIQRRLYIFAGQRNKEHLLDLWWWDVDTNTCRALCRAAAACPPPAAGFTQRATLDPVSDEVFVLSGMSKEKEKNKRVYNTLWVFSLRRLAWACVYRNDSVAPHEPRPRFAHQLVYDPVKKVHYLFGGNPGNDAFPRLRLDDLWALRLTREPPAAAARRARLALREGCYREMTRAGRRDLPAALHYLRHTLPAALDHSAPAEVARFQKLATLLFSGGGAARGASAAHMSARRARRLARRRARMPAPADLAQELAMVLCADESSHPRVENAADDICSLPVLERKEDAEVPEVGVIDTGVDGDTVDDPDGDSEESEDEEEAEEWSLREARIALYDQLCTYFRPASVPPTGDIMDLVTL